MPLMPRSDEDNTNQIRIRNNMDILPETVRAYRVAKNLTQSEFALLACVSEGTVKNWEKNGIPEKRVKESSLIKKIKDHRV